MKILLHRALAISGAALCIGLPAIAQQPIAYPALGQDAARQTRDDGDCRSWAKQTTGIDSTDLARSGTPQESARVRGERAIDPAGAASAGPTGSIDDDRAARAAEIGAATAAERRRTTARPREEMDTYYRAYGGCMERRGYTLT